MSSPTIPQKYTLPLLLATGAAVAWAAFRPQKGDAPGDRPPRVGAVATDTESAGPSRGHAGGVTYGGKQMSKGEAKGT